jgi:hypothetical protein
MSSSVVSIGAMDALVHRCVAAMIARVYGSLATQRINGGQLRIMGRALARENFSWGLMLHAKMVGKLDRCRVADSGDFLLGPSWLPIFWRGCRCCALECYWAHLVHESRD